MKVKATASVYLEVPDTTDLRDCDLQIPTVQVINSKTGQVVAGADQPALHDVDIEEV